MTKTDIRKLEFSVGHLLPLLGCCKEVDQYGHLLPMLFEEIIRGIGTTVERLSLRKLNSHAPPRLLGRFKDPNKWPTVSMDLPFERLKRCKNITSLQVGNLKWQEVPNWWWQSAASRICGTCTSKPILAIMLSRVGS